MRKMFLVIICIGMIASIIGLIVQASPETGWFSISLAQAQKWARLTGGIFLFTGFLVLIYLLTLPASPSRG